MRAHLVTHLGVPWYRGPKRGNPACGVGQYDPATGENLSRGDRHRPETGAQRSHIIERSLREAGLRLKEDIWSAT
ncbi:hypothetical protein NDU88_003281 [Pleurodeles waltl]|uniref:MHC class I antigen n=1 Tax=Pleurodeles waltl TaxID=8319 RepID=A0AAV7UC17_PLEWA|nr:hypothetical protein NDU88_003281 [Pleurodeles waltl]